MTIEALDKVLSTLDVEKTITFFNDMAEKDRKALAPRALQWLEVSSLHHPTDTELSFYLTRAQNQLPGSWGAGMEPTKRIQRLLKQVEDAKQQAKLMPPQVVKKEAIVVAQVALMATSGITDIKKKNAIPLPDHCYRIISARRPSWIPAWIEWITTECPHSHWMTARRLEREGIVTIDHTASYLSGMALALPGDTLQPPNRWENGKVIKAEIIEGTVAESLRADEQLLETVWEMLADDLSMRLLTHEQATPTGRNAWEGANMVRWQLTQLAGERWKLGLLRLCKEQRIDRIKLINAALPIFVRFNLEHSDSASTLKVAWFTELQDALELTQDENFACHQDFLRLLSCRNAKVVNWSLQKLTSLVDHPDFPVEVACESIPTAFLLKGKDHSVQALKCLKEIADKHPSTKRTVAIAAIEALENENSDVQKRALTLLTKLRTKDNDLIALMQNKLPRVNIQHRQQAAEWCGTAATPIEQPDTSVPAADNVVPLRRSKPVEPEADEPRQPSIDLEMYNSRCAAISDKFRIAAKLDSALESVATNVDQLDTLDFAGNEIPRLNPDKLLPILADLDTMIFFNSRLLHRQWNYIPTADELEIVLDGFARLGAEQPADFNARTSALLSTAKAIGFSIDPVMNTTVTWITRQVATNWMHNFTQSLSQLNKVDDVVRRRFMKVGKKLANREATLLLSTPTHEGGWIDPVVLVERVKNSSHAANNSGSYKNLISQFLGALGLSKEVRDIEDECLALLRIAPDNRDLALTNAAKLPRSEFTQALIYALGADDIQIGETAATWIAAARTRSPFSDDSRVEARHPNRGPDGATAARYQIIFTKPQPEAIKTKGHDPKWRLLSRLPAMPSDSKLIDDVLTVQMHTANLHRRLNAHYLDWRKSIRPVSPDAFLAEGVERIASHDGVDFTGKLNTTYLEKLYDPDVPMTPVALLLLAMGLASKQKDEHATAIEALIASIEDGRLCPEKLGNLFFELETSQGLRPSSYSNANVPFSERWRPLTSATRWAKGLKPAALVSAFHSRTIGKVIQAYLQGDPTLASKDVHLFLETLLEILVESDDSICNDKTRSYLTELGRLKSTGKTGTLIKQLLALKPGPQLNSKRQEALQYALERRLERAERWTDWQERNRAAHLETAMVH